MNLQEEVRGAETRPFGRASPFLGKENRHFYKQTLLGCLPADSRPAKNGINSPTIVILILHHESTKDENTKKTQHRHLSP
jgi:hypothetical protein